jgi:hypothetical protein
MVALESHRGSLQSLQFPLPSSSKRNVEIKNNLYREDGLGDEPEEVRRQKNEMLYLKK